MSCWNNVQPAHTITFTLHSSSAYPALSLRSSSVSNGNLVFHVMHLHSQTQQKLQPKKTTLHHRADKTHTSCNRLERNSRLPQNINFGHIITVVHITHMEFSSSEEQMHSTLGLCICSSLLLNSI